MDRYKKTSLKFDKNLGYGRNLRAAEITSSRALLRNSRFSMQRCLTEEEELEEKPKSRIATFGKSALKAPMTREQMLQKWKEEKDMKQQIEAQNKKPTFKIGVSAPKSGPYLSPFNKADSKTFNMKNSQKVSFNVTNYSKGIKETCLKPPSIAKFQANITNRKTPKSKESQIHTIHFKPPTTNLSNSNVKKDSHIQSFKSKPPTTISSNSNVKKDSQIQPVNAKPPTKIVSNSSVKKDLHIQVPNKAKMGLQKLSFIASKQINNKDVSQASSKSGIGLNKPSFIEKSRIQPLSGITKQTESKVFKKSEQVQPSLAGRIPNRVPESKIKPVSHQNSGRLLKVPSKLTAPIKSAGIPNRTGLKPKQEIKTNKEEPSDTNITFSCNISHIEPVEEKSFAPKDFTFNMGAELSFSYLEEGPLALYIKSKAEGRTSTPKRKEIIEIQRQEAATANGKTEEKGSEIEHVLDPQVMQNSTEAPPQQNTTTYSEDNNSKYTLAVTKLLSDDSVSNIVLKESGAQQSNEEIMHHNSTFEIDHLATKDSLQDKSLNTNLLPENSVIDIQEGFLVVKESENSSLKKPSVEENETNVFYTNPTVGKQEALENNANICSTTLDNIKDASLKNSINLGPVKLNGEKKFSFEETKAFIVNEIASVPSYKEKENIPDDVFSINSNIQKIDNLQTDTSGSGILASNKSNIGFENLLEKEAVKLNAEKPIVFEEIRALAMSGTSSSSFSQFKVPVLEGDLGIVTRRRSSSRVGNMSLRGGRRSEMPQLECISESIESSSPYKSPPKPPKTPKSRKSTISKDFTPRRSLRLAKSSVLDCTENLFDIRMSLCGDSPDLPGNSTACDASGISYDFDKLHLEQATEQSPTPKRRISTRTNRKVSLLYTPPQGGRVSTLRKSIKGDLMAFSPDV